jgi:hypothetical protein
MRQIIRNNEEVSVFSPTCQSRMKTRDKGPYFDVQSDQTQSFQTNVRMAQREKNYLKLNESAKQNQPLDGHQTLYPIPDKHMANNHSNMVHTTRRA